MKTEQFLSRFIVNETTQCWEWDGRLSASGYGLCSDKGKNQRAHRRSYEIHKGPIPDGMYVCHTCDNRKCGNPEHLWLGTAADNNADAWAKGRVGAPPPYPGETHALAKLTNGQRAEVQRLNKQGTAMRPLARMFGVSQPTVWRICHGKNYAELSPNG